MRQTILWALASVCSALLFAGCAEDQPQDSNRVSTIPWNRPESWEGKGPMGSMMPGTQ